MFGELVTKKLRKELCGLNLKGQKTMKIFVSFVNAHQRVNLAEKDFNDQVDKVTC